MVRKYLTILISFYIFWLGVIPLVLTKTTNLFCEKYSKTSAYDISVESPKFIFSVIPTINFSANSLSVKSKKDNSNLYIENFDINFRFWPLLSKKLHINKLKAENLEYLVKVNDNIELDKGFFEKIKKIGIKCDKLDVKSFKITAYQQGISFPIIYSGKNLYYRIKNRYLQFKLDSTLTVANSSSIAKWNLYLPKNNDIKRTVFEVDIKDFQLAPLKIYLKHYLPEDLVFLSGIINVHANKGELQTNLKECSLLMKDNSNSIIFPKEINIISDFKISKKNITFEKVDIKSDKIHISFDGIISEYLAKTKTFLNINLQINSSKIEEIIKLLPALKTEEIDIYKLKKYKFYGNILGNINIKGRLPEPEINGDIYIGDAYLTQRIPETKRGATIKMDFIGKNVGFDVEIPVGNTEKVTVNGTQELYNIKYADMVIKSSDNVNLKYAQNVVVPLHEILNFIIGPLPIMTVNGTGNIDMSAKGNRKNPHVWGIMNFKNSNIKFNDIPNMELQNALAILKIQDQEGVFFTKEGKLNEQDFEIEGIFNLKGTFDFNAETKSQPLKEIYKSVQNSEILADLNKMLPNVNILSGIADLKLNIHGTLTTLENFKLNKNVFIKGETLFKNSSVEIQNFTVNNLSGLIKLNRDESEADIKGYMGKDELKIKTKVAENIANTILEIPKFNPNTLIQDTNLQGKQYLPIVSVSAKYKGHIDTIEYNKFKLYSKIIPQKDKNYLNFVDGEIILENGKLNLKNITGFIKNRENGFSTNLRIDKTFSRNPVINGELAIKAPDILFLNDLFSQKILPTEYNSVLKNIEFKKGTVDLDCKIKNNKFNFVFDLGGYELEYLPLELPISIINGTAIVKNNILTLNKINLLADDMPILIDGNIKDIDENPKFNFYVNSKPKQEFIDKYFNKNAIYPIKIKGDIVYGMLVKGSSNDYDLKAWANLSKNSSIYHFGATVGDIENSIILELDTKVLDKNLLKIKEFVYDKLIESQNGKQTRLNMLKAWGGIEIFDTDLGFKDFHIKTNTPTDARIFNIIFRKPNIKQGQFTSDLKFNGKLSNPKVLGDFHIFETDIPFLDTTVKNISLAFKERTIDLKTKGDILDNNIEFIGVLKNKLTIPYHIEKGELYTNDLNVNKIVEKFKISGVDSVSALDTFDDFSLDMITFNNLKLKADRVRLRNINATNLEALTSLNSKGIFEVKDFDFNIAQGTLGGKYSFDLKTSDTILNLIANEISANDITYALFDLQNQIYGDLTGNINLSCNGENFQSCMQTLSGNTNFKVNDGRMPKLGSLEYLLKAGNLLKGGFTGLSINGVIDLLTPLKTGEFSEIKGNIRIKDGVARNIEISTRGKDLSLFVWGTYNFATSIAEMEVFGYLSRKITTMFGAIGNFSVNTLLNTIPGIDLSKDSEALEKINKIPGLELSNKSFRKFLAEIKGNINEDNYVTTFQWIN